MKRSMDLIRELLLRLEGISVDGTSYYILDPSDKELQVEGFSSDQIGYHLSLLREAGLIDPPSGGTLAGGIDFRRLTWSGHDFLDSIRDPEVWDKTKQGAKAAGGFTLDLLKDLAKGLIKKKIQDHTGIEL
ncbi:DUF2513 domain-containing protein [Pseudomonas luteola]|uniref:DUF2513 domain-containing protein n=1 Tax=Pseudomonas luteola TaxID=47886 RepID=UPI001EF3EA77|nr:DUF2513 domain-containing protein [Pseudomonas luteola]MCG7375236.1 DUF2513 domain-containing protein [Pseudomonas luteola]